MAGADTCDAGTLSPEALDDTVRRVSLFRWLVGLDPVVADPDASRTAAVQACAVMMRANGRISHTPDAGWSCYSAEGAAAAGYSNLALGPSHPADAVDLYANDMGVPSLGHRRWILNGPLARVAVGFAGEANCLAVMDTHGEPARPWTAYPSPGPAPVETVLTVWSFHADDMPVALSTVTVTRVSDGADLPVIVMPLDGGYGPSAVGFAQDGWRPSVGERYRVTVTIPDGTVIRYEVVPVRC